MDDIGLIQTAEMDPGKKYLIIVSTRDGYDIPPSDDGVIEDAIRAKLNALMVPESNYQIVIMSGVDINIVAIPEAS